MSRLIRESSLGPAFRSGLSRLNWPVARVMLSASQQPGAGPPLHNGTSDLNPNIALLGIVGGATGLRMINSHGRAVRPTPRTCLGHRLNQANPALVRLYIRFCRVVAGHGVRLRGSCRIGCRRGHSGPAAGLQACVAGPLRAHAAQNQGHGKNSGGRACPARPVAVP